MSTTRATLQALCDLMVNGIGALGAGYRFYHLQRRYMAEYAQLKAQRDGEYYEQRKIFGRCERSKVRVGIALLRTLASIRSVGC